MTWLHEHERAEHDIRERVRPLLPACPEWCVTDHDDDLRCGVETADGGSVVRWHRSETVTIGDDVVEEVTVGFDRLEKVRTSGVVEADLE